MLLACIMRTYVSDAHTHGLHTHGLHKTVCAYKNMVVLVLLDYVSMITGPPRTVSERKRETHRAT